MSYIAKIVSQSHKTAEISGSSKHPGQREEEARTPQQMRVVSVGESMTARLVAVDVWFSAILDGFGSFTVSTGPVSPSFTEHFTFATVVPAEVCFNKANAACSCTDFCCVYFVPPSTCWRGDLGALLRDSRGQMRLGMYLSKIDIWCACVFPVC